MTVIEKGKAYVITDSAGREVQLNFCHTNDEGIFVHGLRMEDLIDVLIHRQSFFVHDLKRSNDNNFQTLLHMKQARLFMHQRTQAKLIKRKTTILDAHDKGNAV